MTNKRFFAVMFFPAIFLAAIIWAAWFVICAPTIKVTAKQDEVVIDAQTLGEYPTAVKRLTISSPEEGTILDLKAASEHTQLGLPSTLHVGHNEVNQIILYSGSLKRDPPSSGRGFTLRHGVCYRIRIWSGSSSSSASFSF